MSAICLSQVWANVRLAQYRADSNFMKITAWQATLWNDDHIL